MKELLQIAYFLALALWVPLGILAAVKPSIRGSLMAPLVMSVAAMLYEGFMRSAYPTAIRVDIFIALLVLGLVDLIAGVALFAVSRLAATLCLGVPVLAIAGLFGLKSDTDDVTRNLDLARRFRFEAAFRDDATQKRVFGDLSAGANPWAGYYVYAGKDDDRFAHLVVNDAGRFWIYHQKLYDYAGTGAHSAAADAFEGKGEGRMNERMRISLRRGEGGLHILDVDYGNIPQSPQRPAAMRKADPPRFPRGASASDEVRFAGVFSAAYGERDGGFWLTQVWLWESAGEWWGQYERDHYKRGFRSEFISTEKIDPECSEQCKVLSFKSSRGAVKLSRVSADEYLVVGEGEDKKGVALKRGETLPGFYFDLAPTATKENREWLKALTTAGMITWDVPKD